MAYVLKYTSTFFSHVDNTQYDLKIYEEGYGGITSEISIGNLTLSRGSSDMLDAIKGSELNVEVINESDFLFENEFGTASYGDFFVRLYEGANVRFQGYNIPNTYSEPYLQTPYLTSLSFNCGLGHLKYKKFEDSGTLYSGQKSILEVIRLCLNKLPNASTVGQSIRESINTYEKDLYAGSPTTAESMINSIYVDAGVYKEEADEVFEGWSCYDVLEAILKVFFGRIYSWNNYWYIDQIQEQKTSPIYFRDFLPRVGTESTLTVDSSGNYNQFQSVNRITIHPTPEGEITIIPKLEKIRYKYNTQNVEYAQNDLLVNPSFDNIVNQPPSGNYAFAWSYTGVDPSTYNAVAHNFLIYNINNMTGLYNMSKFPDANVYAASTFDDTKYISQSKTNVPTASTDKLMVTIKLFNQLNPNSSTQTDYSFWYTYGVGFRMKHRIMLKVGSYYLVGTSTSYSWSTTAGTLYFETAFDLIGLYSPYKRYSTISFITPFLPTNALVSVDFRFYQPFSNIPDSSGYSGVDSFNSYYDVTSITYLPAAAAPEETIILQHEIDEEAEQIDVDVVHGDGPNTISQGSFRLSDGTITNGWAKRSDLAANKGIADLWIEDISELRSEFVRNLSWSVLGDLQMYNVLTHTVDAVQTFYLINGFERNFVTDTNILELIELKTNTRTAFTTTTNVIETAIPLEGSFLGDGISPSNSVARLSYSDTSIASGLDITSFNTYPRTNYNGFYTFNENSATTIRDYSEQGNDGVGSNMTISATTRTYGKDAVFNGTTSKIDFPSTTDWQGLLLLSFRISVNITSNTGTDTILKIPNVLELKFDGSYFILDFTTIVSTYTITQTGTAITIGEWYDVTFSTKTNSFALIIYDDNGDEFFNSSTAKADVTNTGSFPIYLGYDGSSNYANFKCNELQLRTAATTTNTTLIDNQNGVLITTFNSFSVGDIISVYYEGLSIANAIVTYSDSFQYNILPVSGEASSGLTFERVGHLWDTTRQWMFIINNDPSICFYDGISLTSEIAAASKKIYCLNKNGIIKNIISKSSNYTLINNNEIILVDCSLSDVTITCPPSADATPSGKVFEIIDIGNANPNRVIINGGDFTINGESSTTITEPYEVRKIIFTGTEYILI